MDFEIGIDIVSLEELSGLVRANPNLLQKMLHPEEYLNRELAFIAGRIAVKEAVLKTGFI